MKRLHLLACATLVLASPSPAAIADDSIDAGRKIFRQHCQTCHGGTGPADTRIGPDLSGIIGRQAGTGSTGVHSRANVESEKVWTRSSLRRYLSDPGREIPGTIMYVPVRDPKELDDVLNFLETLR
jgi:cytochrome c